MTIQMTGADVIDLAVRTEVRGERFYRQAAEQATSQSARALFRHLADEEVRHRRTFEELAPSIVSTEIDPSTWEEAMAYIEVTVDRASFQDDDAAILSVPKGEDERTMIAKAIDFEKETLLFFTTLRDLVQPANQSIVDDIAREERRHIARLGRMLGERASED